jgi:hypothetical protein
VDSLAKSIIKKLKTESYEGSVYDSLINAVGELSNINGSILLPELNLIIPILLRAA